MNRHQTITSGWFYLHSIYILKNNVRLACLAFRTQLEKNSESLVSLLPYCLPSIGNSGSPDAQMLPLAALKNKKNSDQKHWHPIASLLGSTRGYLSLSENTLIQDLNILHWHWNNLLQTYCCFFFFFLNEKQTKPKQSIKSNVRPLETLSRQSWWPTPLAGFMYRAGIDLLYSWLSVLAATVLSEKLILSLFKWICR